jgi:hypothetical protein
MDINEGKVTPPTPVNRLCRMWTGIIEEAPLGSRPRLSVLTVGLQFVL